MPSADGEVLTASYRRTNGWTWAADHVGFEVNGFWPPPR